MSFGIVHSSERHNIYDMYSFAENIAKLNSKTEEFFVLFISDTVDFFMKKCPTANTLNSQRTFLQHVSNALVRGAVISNKQFEQIHRKPDNDGK